MSRTKNRNRTSYGRVTGGNVPILCAFATALISPLALADEGLEEIVVTAQRRAQSAQDVPIAITALSADALTNLGVTSSEQLAAFTPNVTWNPTGFVGAAVGIRGVVDTVATTNQVGSVAIVVDEVSLNSPVLNVLPVFDLDRVEVLRGPQVALYGRSTTGGAVNFITRHPEVGGESNGRAVLSLGNYQDVNFEGGVGVPLGEIAAVRLAVLSDKRDGIFSDPTLGRDIGAKDQQAARLSFAAKPTDSFSVFAKFEYGRDRSDGGIYKNVGWRNPDGTSCLPTSSNPGSSCVDGSGFRDTANFRQAFTDAPVFQHVDVHGGLVNLKWRLDGMSITSITSYYKNSYQRYADPDGGPASLNELHVNADTKQVAEELRLASEHDSSSPINWIIGAYLFKETQDGLIANVQRVAQIQPQPFPPPTWFPPFPQFRSMLYDQDDKIRSGYFQVDWKFAPNLELTVGGRYSSEEKSGEASTLRCRVAPAASIFCFGAAAQPPIGTPFDAALARAIADPLDSSAAPTPFGKTWNNAGGKIGLNWRPAASTLYYASISRGFKGGTFNFIPAVDLTGYISPSAPATFKAGVAPEKLTTYELGAKLEFLNRTLRLNMALFRNDYKDQQTAVFQDGGLVLINAASSTTNGFEAELNWAPGENWLIQAGLGLLDDKYSAFVDPAGEVFTGGKIVQASDVTANGLIQKSFDLGAGRLSAQVGFKYFSAYYPVAEYVLPSGYPTTNPTPVSYAPVDRIDAHTLVDARIGYAFGGKREFEVALWGHNLSDQRFCTTTGQLPWGMSQCAANEPRTYGVQLRAGF